VTEAPHQDGPAETDSPPSGSGDSLDEAPDALSQDDVARDEVAQDDVVALDDVHDHDVVDDDVVDDDVHDQDVAAEGVTDDVAGADDGAGNPRIAEAVARLRELGDSPPEQHIEVYEELHQVLQETLSDAQQPGDTQQPGDGTGGARQ
jgi:propanediol dehydratase small subunit